MKPKCYRKVKINNATIMREKAITQKFQRLMTPTREEKKKINSLEYSAKLLPRVASR